MGKRRPSQAGTAAELWRQVANLYACKRVPALVLQMESTARDVRMAIRNHKSPEAAGEGEWLSVLQNYFAPDAMDAVYQHVAQFLHFCKAAQAADKNVAKFDLLRRTAEGRTKHSGATPDAFLAVSRLPDAILSRPDKSLVVASTHGNSVATEVAQQIRRPSGLLGASGRQDILFAYNDCEDAVSPAE